MTTVAADFIPADLIRKKRAGLAHTADEIRFLVQGYARDQIPDYQMAAWLMAVCLRGMTPEETTQLTVQMRDSGEVFTFADLGVTVDKHSTGGVGDKISLILAPLVAAAGVTVPMVAGRGLGHTGGTLDKLQSITGFNVDLNFAQFAAQLRTVGTAIMGQTPSFCPADRKMYALRDVTGTVDSLPLICASIMSKKLAEGIDALVLDVKFGTGAFMKTLGDGENLARALIEIGSRAGKKAVALVTRMDEPLGRFVGNALEVRECLEILQGTSTAENLRGLHAQGAETRGDAKSSADVIELTIALAAQMIYLGGQAKTVDDGAARARTLLADGSALAKFRAMCLSQGGDLEVSRAEAPARLEVRALSGGFMHYTDVEKLGQAAILLGAGRKFSTDEVDFAAGVEVLRANGGRVREGDILFRLFAASEPRLAAAEPVMRESFTITGSPAISGPLIAKVIS